MAASEDPTTAALMARQKNYNERAEATMAEGRRLLSMAESGGEYHTVQEINEKLDQRSGGGGSVVLTKPLLIRKDDPPLNMDWQVTLIGPYLYTPPTSYSPYANNIYIEKGEADEWGEPAILPALDAALIGHCFVYPNQKRYGGPITYSPTISYHTQPDRLTSGFTVENCMALNPYRFINLPNTSRVRFRSIYGQPYRTGLHLGGLDVGYIQDVHFWPFNTLDKGIMTFIYEYGEAFVLGKADWFKFDGLFGFGYRNLLRVYRAAQFDHGATGPDVTIYALQGDACQNGIVIEPGRATGHVLEIHGTRLAGNTYFVNGHDHGGITPIINKGEDVSLTVYGLNAHGAVKPFTWKNGNLQIHGGLINSAPPTLSGGHGAIRGLGYYGGTKYLDRTW